ncbi:unnamed protein product [Victoria cruziana]
MERRGNALLFTRKIRWSSNTGNFTVKNLSTEGTAPMGRTWTIRLFNLYPSGPLTAGNGQKKAPPLSLAPQELRRVLQCRTVENDSGRRPFSYGLQSGCFPT